MADSKDDGRRNCAANDGGPSSGPSDDTQHGTQGDNPSSDAANGVKRGTISGAMGGAQRVGRRWEASESGSFKVISNSSSTLKAIHKGDVNPNDRLSISVLTDDSNVPLQNDLLADKDRSKRTPYVAVEGDHLGKVAMKAYGKSGPRLESLILRTNPHLEVRRSFSIEHSIDRSYLQSGVAFELPSWNEVDELT